MKNIKKIIECQQVSKEKKKKGEIVRHNATLISARNLLYPNIDLSLSHEKAQQMRQLIQSMPYHERLMLDKLLAKIIHRGNIKIARKYFTQMLKMSEKTISRYVRVFEELDLIRVAQFFDKVNEFSIGPAALNEIIRNTLMPYITSLRLLVKLPLALLATSQVQSSDVPLYNMKYLNNNSITITKSIRRGAVIRSLELTDAGKINLSIFPKEAIAFADDKLIKALQKGVGVANPFEFLCKVAHAWCKDSNINPDYRSMFQQYEQEGLQKDSLKFTKILISKSAIAIARNTNKSTHEEPKSNPVPNIDLPGACCYFNSLDHEGQCKYIKRQMGAYKLDENGKPTTLAPFDRHKLTCRHS